MTRDEVQRQTECIAQLATQLSKQPRLQAELQRARRQFFGDDLLGAGNDAAEHRFAEWFLMERESESLGVVPVTIPPYSRDIEPLEGSLVGLFLVESVGDTVTAIDMQDEEVVELAEAGTLKVGDLLVGRMYPVSGERWAPSAATPALRPGRALAKAFLQDLAKLELGRRLLQIELEHLLLREHGGTSVSLGGGSAEEPASAEMVVAPDAPLEHLEADLEQLMLAVGLEHSVTDISEQLAQTLHPGAVMGPLLDQLAFDTDIDLDRIRRVLLEIWNAHHAGQTRSTEEPGSGLGPPGETLGEQLARKLEDGIGEQEDVEDLFKQMESMAGIEPDEDDSVQDGRNTAIVAEVFETGETDGDAGDLAPLVAEFHWENGNNEPEQSALTLWIELQRSAAVPNTDVELIPAGDLMRLLLHVYLRSAPGERVAQVRGAFDELRRFYDWIVETQEIDQREVLKRCQGALLDQLERLQAAGIALSNDQAPVQSPGLMQVEETGADGFGARDDDGGSHWLLAAKNAVDLLAAGDIVLGGFAPIAGDEPTSLHRRLAGMVVVLPIDARSLIE
ncbi:MAG: hypothetical protein ACI89X_004421 [Planctomycetota bacterium]|jgi:hypothetical protein